MGFFDDERGVSVQVGAVVLLAFVVIAISAYQVQVVPSQNEEVELNHNREVQERMQDLRDTVGTVPARGVGGSVAVPLGTRYPARSIFVNPPPPTGLLRTVGTTNDSVGFTVDNASALDGETADYWNGTARSFSTGAIVYVPRYNVYESAPTTVYENSLAYNRFRTANITLTNQDVFDGNRITLTALDGEVRREGGTASLTVRSVTPNPRTVTVENTTGEQLTVTIPTTLSAAEWERLLAESGQYDPTDSDPNAYVSAVRSNRTLDTSGQVPLYLVTFELEPDEEYRLRLAKAGVGTGVTPVQGGTYLSAEGGTDRSVSAGGSETLTVSVSDRFNSLQSGVLVNASVESGGGSISGDADRRTGDDGRVSFVYDAPSSPGSATVAMNISTSPNASERVTFDITVTAGGGTGGGNGAYNVTWHHPDNATLSTGSITCSQDPPGAVCTIDAGGQSSVDLPMVMFTDTVADGAGVDYAVSNGTVGSVSPTNGTTNSTGENRTTLTVTENGSVTTYVTSGAGGDRVEFTVEGVASGPPGDTTPPQFAPMTSVSINNPNGNKADQLTFDYDTSDDVAVQNVSFTAVNDQGTTLVDSLSINPNTTTTYNIPEQKMNQRTVTVTIRVNDTSGNYEECTFTINSAGVTQDKSQATCTTATPMLQPVPGGPSSPSSDRAGPSPRRWIDVRVAP
ncbi:hypothetical protein [Haloarchaeobius baliensis]|uniref:hypothetical protein n=1 Tax=Haloarchaeobius baliensis TaxID=1670458 RepID=UPI003F880A68